MTTNECGMKSSSRMPLASTTPCSEKSACFPRAGLDPVAIIMNAALKISLRPSGAVTRTECASTISPRPQIISTPASSKSDSMRSCSSICTRVRRAMKRVIDIRSHAAPWFQPGIGRRRNALATSAVSRNAFDAIVPVFTIAPPGRDSISITATRRPNDAA